MELLKNKTDQEIIHLYISGDENGLKELLNRYKSKVYTSIFIRVKDEYLAEDLFQETFIKVINTFKSGRYNDEGKFLPWAMRVAFNVVIDHFRKVKRSPVVINSEGYDIFEILTFSEDNSENRMLRDQMDVDLKRLIKLLPDEQKEVLIMRYYCDMSFKEIAEITDVSINTALGRMRYALANLRRMIDEHKFTFQF